MKNFILQKTHEELEEFENQTFNQFLIELGLTKDDYFKALKGLCQNRL